jgi:hypothetical protein
MIEVGEKKGKNTLSLFSNFSLCFHRLKFLP